LASASHPERLKLLILKAMMDDAEDIEQIYLSINGSYIKKKITPDFPLREIIDGINLLLDGGFVAARRSDDHIKAPLDKIDSGMLHYYYFSPTKAGHAFWDENKAELKATKS
jgi:hypothetical protein